MNETINTIFNEGLIILGDLHFIRADWFYSFIPLFLFLLLSYKKTSSNKNWLDVIDPQLLPFVLNKSAGKQRRYPLLLVLIASSLCITALAGPVYKKLPQPVYREQSSLIVLLDLSQSMNASDIKPSRLARTKLELLDLLKARKTGQTALIVYAADAFVVTPLTDDNATIANLVPSLETDMMPAQGSNLAKALAKTVSLFTQSGVIKGDILVMTDDIHQREESAIKKVTSQGYRLSIFGIGTTDGGPIPLAAEAGGGFLQDSQGAIVIPKLQPGKLQRFALSGGGLYTSLRASDDDVNKLSALFQSSEITQPENKKTNNKNKDESLNENLSADLWQEEGHWLLLPLLFFAALWARKGWLAIILIFILPLPQPAYAAAIDTEHLWSSPDQKAMRAFNNGDLEQAAKNFTSPEWKASALYRKGDYEAAAKALENSDSSDGNYNKGNALAKQGKLEDSIKAYDKAIEFDSNNADARYNREQVEQVLKKQQQDSKQKNDQSQDEQQQDKQQDKQKQDEQKQGESEDEKKQDDSNKDQQQQDQQQSSEQNNDEQQQDSQQQNNQSSEQSEDKEQQQSTQKNDSKKQQQAEQEQLKQRDAKTEAEQQKKEQQQYQKNQQKKQPDQPQNSEEADPDQADPDQADSEQAKKEIEHKDAEEKPMEVEVNPIEASITEEEKATEQWLKRVPDDPGGLLRRKFYYQYKQIPNQKDSEQPW